MEKNLDITKPRYSENILAVFWPFVISLGLFIWNIQDNNNNNTFIHWYKSYKNI